MSIAYASGTKVSVERSRAEIDAVLTKNGATQTAIMNDSEGGLVAVGFSMRGMLFRIKLPLPMLAEAGPPKGKEPKGWGSKTEAQKLAWRSEVLEQLRRERWRQILLLIKSKLEIVRIGLSSLEKEFLADLILPDGHTAGETVGQYMAELIANGYTAPLALPEARP